MNDSAESAKPESGQDPVVRRWQPPAGAEPAVPEIGGRKDGPEPTRYGDWEKNGRCIDF